MMTSNSSMTALEAHKLVLLNHADKWAKSVRNTDGLVYTMFSGSAGQTYWTTEKSCSCKGFEWRQRCAHQAAVAEQAERARAKAFAPKRRYEDLFGDDELTSEAF
jgi:hypothetical protein